MKELKYLRICIEKSKTMELTPFMIERLEDVFTRLQELEALQQPKRCDGCWYGKTTINSVICGKNGTYKEADDYCKYYNPKEQRDESY